MSSLRNIINKYIENVYNILYTGLTNHCLQNDDSNVGDMKCAGAGGGTDLVSGYKCCDHLATTEAGMRPHQWRATVAGPGPGATSVPVIRFSGGGYCLHH